MLHPELPAGATEREAAEIASVEDAEGRFDAYVSCNRTCEMGMTAATGRPYRHVLEVLEELTREQPAPTTEVGDGAEGRDSTSPAAFRIRSRGSRRRDAGPGGRGRPPRSASPQGPPASA